MKYILIEVDDTLDLSPLDVRDVAYDIADLLSDVGVTAQVIFPIPTHILVAIEG